MRISNYLCIYLPTIPVIMRKMCFILLVALTVSSGLYSQTTDMYISIDGGVALYNGEEDLNGSLTPIGNVISPALRIGIGKDFNTAWGIRGTLNMINVRGVSSGRGWYSYYDNNSRLYTSEPIYYNRAKADGKLHYTDEYDTRGYFYQDMYYIGIGCDVMVNLVGACKRTSGYWKPFEISLYMGPELFFVLPSATVPFNFLIGARAGIFTRTRLSDIIDFNINLGTHFVPDVFDGEVGGAQIETMFDATIGLSFNIDLKRCKNCP